MLRLGKLGTAVAGVVAGGTMAITFMDCVGSIATVTGPSMQVGKLDHYVSCKTRKLDFMFSRILNEYSTGN